MGTKSVPGEALCLKSRPAASLQMQPPARHERVEGEGQEVFRYVHAHEYGIGPAAPNGSTNDIAGVCNAAGNVVGLMPHPERAVEAALGCADGLALFQSLKNWLEAR